MGFVPFTFVDFIDIILVAVIMYWIYRMTKGTNAPYILSGIIAIYLLWVVVRTLNMELLSTILGQLISVGAIALIIVFQPELRRFLQMIGMRQKHFNFITRIFSTGEDTVQTNVVPIVTACRETSSACASASCDSPRSLRSARMRAPSSLSIESLLCVDGAIVAVFGAKVHQVFRYYR